MYSDIKEYVDSCIVCQQAKRPAHPLKTPLKNLDTVDLLLRWGIDLAGPLKVSKSGMKYILVAIESLSMWTELILIPDQSAETVATALYTQIFCGYGCPSVFLSDRGSNFLSKIVDILCQLFKVRKTFTISYRPQSMGQVEVRNSHVWKCLRALCPDQTDWPDYIPLIAMAHNGTSCAASRNASPFFVMFGREMLMPTDSKMLMSENLLKVNAKEYLQKLLPRLEVMREAIKMNIDDIQSKL